jgi:putative glutamine amidotransferase
LSYDQGTPKYRLYVGALLAAAEQAGVDDEVEAVWLAGAGKPFDPADLAAIDGLLMTGGADVEPQRYGFLDPDRICETFPGRDDAEIAILEGAIARRLPMLAICRGMQLLNVVRGGTLVPDLPEGEGHLLPDDERHSVEIARGSALHHLLGVDHGEVSSSHHQAVGELGQGLRAVAHHESGTVEAMEWSDPMRKPWLVAVQWHPERMGLDEPLAGLILSGFLDAVRARS